MTVRMLMCEISCFHGLRRNSQQTNCKGNLEDNEVTEKSKIILFPIIHISLLWHLTSIHKIHPRTKIISEWLETEVSRHLAIVQWSVKWISDLSPVIKPFNWCKSMPFLSVSSGKLGTAWTETQKCLLQSQNL